MAGMLVRAWPWHLPAQHALEPIMLHRIADRARLLTMTVGPLALVALVLVAGRRWA
jgi:hypothetical protein